MRLQVDSSKGQAAGQQPSGSINSESVGFKTWVGEGTGTLRQTAGVVLTEHSLCVLCQHMPWLHACIPVLQFLGSNW
jgi:hypothetical protein